MTALLRVENLTRRYGALRAVSDLSFEVERGQITGFVGPNGAGKTTTMRIASTLDVPDEGDIFVDGVSVLVEPRLARLRIGYMADQFQQPAGQFQPSAINPLSAFNSTPADYGATGQTGPGSISYANPSVAGAGAGANV